MNSLPASCASSALVNEGSLWHPARAIANKTPTVLFIIGKYNNKKSLLGIQQAG